MENNENINYTPKLFLKSLEVIDPEQIAEYERREVGTRLSVWGNLVRDFIIKYTEENPEVTSIEISWDKQNGLKNRFMYYNNTHII